MVKLSLCCSSTKSRQIPINLSRQLRDATGYNKYWMMNKLKSRQCGLRRLFLQRAKRGRGCCSALLIRLLWAWPPLGKGGEHVNLPWKLQGDAR